MRIAIVNDSPSAVYTLRRALALRPHAEVIWTAAGGAEAVALCAKLPPDIVLLQLSMSGMDGVETTRRIMATRPCAILLVTENIHTNASRVFEAMGRGALDAIDMPLLAAGSLRQGAEVLLQKIETLLRLTGVKQHTPGAAEPGKSLVAIGASAGGPGALSTVLRALPADFPSPIVIVQHLDQQFAAGMTEWLNDHSALRVRVASEGEEPAPGNVLIAGTGNHLVLKCSNRLGYTPEPHEASYRPSVDVFFRSVSQFWRGDVIGVLLTGMGRDGAVGLKTLRNHGHHTIAQDEATSAVYGMPKAAVTLDAAVEVLPVTRIAAKLTELACV